VQELPLAKEGEALTPAACIAALLLGRQAAGSRSPEPEVQDGLLAWLRGGLCTQVTRHEDRVMQGYVASAALGALAEGQDSEWWAVPAGALRTLVCDVLMPSWLLGRTDPELEAHQGSPICRLLPTAAAALAYCLPHLREEWQASLVMQPLEVLCGEWAAGWESQPADACEAAVRLWFASVVFLLVNTVARQVDLRTVGAECLLRCLRAMAHADIFREDTGEYRALCRSVVECGAARPGFTEALVWTLGEFHTELCRADIDAKAEAGPPMRFLSRVHFLLGVMACPEVIDADPFFPSVWPVVLSCVRGAVMAEGGRSDERVMLATRAHGLAGVALGHTGISSRVYLVREYLEASAAALAATPREDLCSATLSTTAVLAKDMAVRCDREGGSGESRELQHWALQLFSGSMLGCLGQGETEAAEALFKVLCTVAEHVDLACVPDTLYAEARLHELLAAHPPAREIWLRHLVVRFHERARELLVLRLLDDYPEALAAFSEGGAASSAEAGAQGASSATASASRGGSAGVAQPAGAASLAGTAGPAATAVLAEDAGNAVPAAAATAAAPSGAVAAAGAASADGASEAAVAASAATRALSAPRRGDGHLQSAL